MWLFPQHILFFSYTSLCTVPVYVHVCMTVLHNSSKKAKRLSYSVCVSVCRLCLTWIITATINQSIVLSLHLPIKYMVFPFICQLIFTCMDLLFIYPIYQFVHSSIYPLIRVKYQLTPYYSSLLQPCLFSISSSISHAVKPRMF